MSTLEDRCSAFGRASHVRHPPKSLSSVSDVHVSGLRWLRRPSAPPVYCSCNPLAARCKLSISSRTVWTFWKKTISCADRSRHDQDTSKETRRNQQTSRRGAKSRWQTSKTRLKVQACRPTTCAHGVDDSLSWTRLPEVIERHMTS